MGEGPRPVANGKYVFADLDELRSIITEWTATKDRIAQRGSKLRHAIGLITPPAEDTVSRLHALRTRASLQKALEHNDAMTHYAQEYVDKLTAARAQYTDSEAQATATIRQSGEG
jgi:hypothetical protein